MTGPYKLINVFNDTLVMLRHPMYGDRAWTRGKKYKPATHCIHFAGLKIEEGGE